MSSLAARLDYLSDTEFAQQLLSGQVEIPLDVDDTTTIILEDISRLGMTIESFAGEKLVITPKKFHHYWNQVREETASSASKFHFGRYRTATHSEKNHAILHG